ncbi:MULTISPECIES: TspO/MBR family protein [Pseudofrankia]|uniref:TspO/MBR family protein n=1 Tax=Pseudofrankia TaxID=2994363 RepID=UPI000234D373|nr:MULTISPECIES: TspO/MBR family protein [Pseudofrankia]OHV35321.1 TspO protein [Pseudofrankia sp. EUN1h]
MSVPTLVRTGLATAGAAALGAVATSPDSNWYRTLDKPAWQPPPAAFPAVWTPLYALIAFAGARALDGAAQEQQRRRLRRVFAIDLALNAGWTPLFFRARRPRWALAEIAALDAANLALLACAWRADRPAAAALLPYVAWTGFATALNAAIATRNPDSADRPRSSSRGRLFA